MVDGYGTDDLIVISGFRQPKMHDWSYPDSTLIVRLKGRHQSPHFYGYRHN